MGLFDFVKNQFIEVIEATDFQQDMIVFEFPVAGHEIKMGAQLIVREGQCAIFLNEGTLADVFGPGHYTLSTENMPVLSKLKAWKYGFNSPFKAEVFFVSTRLFTNQKWGTQKPVLMREVFGTLPSFTTKDITEYLRRMITSSLADTIGESNIAAIDMANSYDELGMEARKKVQVKFGELGLGLQSLTIESISLPEEGEKVIDKRTSMGVLGDMGKYTQYQAAEAIRDFAQNEGGGIAGMGVGMGAGVQVGQVFAGAMNQNMAPRQPAAPAPAPAQTIACASCGAQVPASAKFCTECGKNPQPAGETCPGCGATVAAGAKFCPECGKPLQQVCSKCGAKVTGKFCPECGTPAGN